MTDQEFLSGIKAGQYIKTKCRDDKPCVRKVTKLTRTQIVINEGFHYDDTPRIDRFRISDGCRINGYESWYSRTQIISDPVSQEEIDKYEARMAENERWRKERKRINEIEVWAKARLVSLFRERIPADNIKVQSNSGFFEIKCEKISEETLVSMLEKVKAEGE